MKPSRPSQRGVSLLESFLALVMLSIGLLGVLGLQTAALVNSRASRSQINARLAADDMAARMQANPSIQAAMIYAGIRPGNSNPEPALNCATAGRPCTPTQMARFDAWEWQNILSRRLPSGHGAVRCLERQTDHELARCRRYAIAIAWIADRPGDAAGPRPSEACAKTATTKTENDPSLDCLTVELQW